VGQSWPATGPTLETGPERTGIFRFRSGFARERNRSIPVRSTPSTGAFPLRFQGKYKATVPTLKKSGGDRFSNLFRCHRNIYSSRCTVYRFIGYKSYFLCVCTIQISVSCKRSEYAVLAFKHDTRSSGYRAVVWSLNLSDTKG
jgi:hypothetical protein